MGRLFGMLFSLLTGFAGMLYPSSAVFAAGELEQFTKIALVSLGVEGNVAIAVENPGPSADCALGGFIAFDPSTERGKLIYATVLSAQLSDEIVNVVYSQNGAECLLTQIAVF